MVEKSLEEDVSNLFGEEDSFEATLAKAMILHAGSATMDDVSNVTRAIKPFSGIFSYGGSVTIDQLSRARAGWCIYGLLNTTVRSVFDARRQQDESIVDVIEDVRSAVRICKNSIGHRDSESPWEKMSFAFNRLFATKRTGDEVDLPSLRNQYDSAAAEMHRWLMQERMKFQVLPQATSTARFIASL